MKDRRKPASQVTPEYEDRGIFKNPTTQLVVELVPRFGKNSRGDVMIMGFLQGNVPVDVVFAGRRKAQAAHVMQELRILWSRANREVPPNGTPPEVEWVRLPVRIEGAWRPRFERDDQGWQTRTHQLFAARWLLTDAEGNALSFGEPPIKGRVLEPVKLPARK